MGKDGIKWAQYQYEDDKPKCSKYSNRILHLERLPSTAYVQNINDPIKDENTWCIAKWFSTYSNVIFQCKVLQTY